MGSLVVYKGDDTTGTFGRHLQFIINVEQGVSLQGCVAQFTVHGLTKTWSNITPGQSVEIKYTHDETAAMPCGQTYGIFRIVDATNNIRTFDDAVPFTVTKDIRQVYPGSSTATVLVGMLVKWEDISGRPASVVQKVNNNPPDASGNVVVVQKVNNISPDANGNVSITTPEFHPLTQADVFDMDCNDWVFRKALARIWGILGGKVINND